MQVQEQITLGIKCKVYSFVSILHSLYKFKGMMTHNMESWVF